MADRAPRSLAIDDDEEGGAEEGGADEEGEEGREEGEDAEEDPARREIKWSLPQGMTVAEKPAKLDESLLGVLILMRWAAPHGWVVGKITTQITASTPRLFKNFNFRCTWSDGWTNLLLKPDEYKGGPTAPYGSWVILKKDTEPPQQMQE